MNKFLLTLGCLLCVILAGAQQRWVNIKTGTTVINTGVQVTTNFGYGSTGPGTPSQWNNNGVFYDTTAGGSFNVLGNLYFLARGKNYFYDFINNGGKYVYAEYPVNIFHTLTNYAGDTLDGNSAGPDTGILLMPNANLVNNGTMYDTIRGFRTFASVITGGCPATFYTTNLSINVSGTTMRYQWQSSTDSATWTNISGATNATYTATVTATSYFQCDLKEVNTASTTW